MDLRMEFMAISRQFLLLRASKNIDDMILRPIGKKIVQFGFKPTTSGFRNLER